MLATSRHIFRKLPNCNSSFSALRLLSTTQPIFQASKKYDSEPPPTHNGVLHQYAQYLIGLMPRFIQQTTVYKDELTLHVAPSSLIPVAQILRDHTNAQFTQLMDIAGVDFPTRENRFEVVYHFLSQKYNSRVRVKTYASETSPVPSLTPLFNSANWFEREAWDMFGIYFEGHPDLRRILTDYGFEGHPFRKDFPLTGYVEVRYDAEKKRVVAEPLEMAQAHRNFDYSSPWEQTGPGVDDTPKEKKQT